LITIRREQLRAFEGLLVNEFRACQAFFDLMKDERFALSTGDVARLLLVAAHKELGLSRLAEIEAGRQRLLQEIQKLSDFDDDERQALTFADLIAVLEPESAQQFAFLQEGILVLMVQMREMTHINRALATYALNRASVLQTYLADLCQIPDYPKSLLSNRPWGQNEVESKEIVRSFRSVQPDASDLNGLAALPALFATVMAARDVLNTKESAGIADAMKALQKALENLDKFLELNHVRQQQLKEITWQMEVADFSDWRNFVAHDSVNLVEVMADLYHQETAYQAVLKVSDRMLASV